MRMPMMSSTPHHRSQPRFYLDKLDPVKLHAKELAERQLAEIGFNLVAPLRAAGETDA